MITIYPAPFPQEVLQVGAAAVWLQLLLHAISLPPILRT